MQKIVVDHRQYTKCINNSNYLGGIAMVKVYVDTITEDAKLAAKIIANHQKQNVKIIAPKETLEVHYEKEEKT